MLWYREQCLKISGLYNENCAHGRHLKFMRHVIAEWWLRAFVKGTTSDNKPMNICEIGLFHIVWGVSKGTCDNYHEFWWKWCFMSKIYRYIWVSAGRVGDVYVPPYIFCLLFKKTEKVQEHDLYLNQILHHFDLKHFFLGWIIKNLWKGRPRGPRFYFFTKWV